MFLELKNHFILCTCWVLVLSNHSYYRRAAALTRLPNLWWMWLRYSLFPPLHVTSHLWIVTVYLLLTAQLQALDINLPPSVSFLIWGSHKKSCNRAAAQYPAHLWDNPVSVQHGSISQQGAYGGRHFLRGWAHTPRPSPPFFTTSGFSFPAFSQMATGDPTHLKAVSKVHAPSALSERPEDTGQWGRLLNSISRAGVQGAVSQEAR